MYKLDYVLVEGFWGKNRIETNFNEDVNIFIGSNGTGKTTFISLLQAIININIPMLAEINFKSAELGLKYKNSTRKIQINKDNSDSAFEFVTYRISKTPYKFPLIIQENTFQRRRYNPKYIEEIEQCRNKIKGLIGLTWLSVHRNSDELLSDEGLSYRKEILEKAPIDIRVEILMRKFTQYQLELELKMNRLSKQYQKDVLSSILYDEEIDKINIAKFRDISTGNVEDGLLHAYRDLDAVDKNVQDLIHKHAEKINSSIESLNKCTSLKKAYNMNDVVPFILFLRTQKIINLSKSLEKEKEDIYSQVLKYLQIMEKYFVNKKIVVGANANGEMYALKDKEHISIQDLSSGEKQLLVLFTEALLQEEKEQLFIADEPELSLHIEWQKELIKSIRLLNPNSQVIVATHSPEIAALWNNKIIEMETIIK